MNNFKKYVISIAIATIIMILFAIFAPIEWNDIITPSEQRRDLIQNCIDNFEFYKLSDRECTELYPINSTMTRPLIQLPSTTNLTGIIDPKVLFD